MTREELVQQLRDISPPPEPAWWQPAPGQLALILLVAALAVAFACWRARRRSARLVEQARRELRRIESRYHGRPDPSRLSLELAGWLKRVALLAFPERRLEGATGETWLEFLDQALGGGSFTRGAGRIFGGAVYARDVGPDSDRLLRLCESWLEAVSPQLRRRGSS